MIECKKKMLFFCSFERKSLKITVHHRTRRSNKCLAHPTTPSLCDLWRNIISCSFPSRSSVSYLITQMIHIWCDGYKETIIYQVKRTHNVYFLFFFCWSFYLSHMRWRGIRWLNLPFKCVSVFEFHCNSLTWLIHDSNLYFTSLIFVDLCRNAKKKKNTDATIFRKQLLNLLSILHIFMHENDHHCCYILWTCQIQTTNVKFLRLSNVFWRVNVLSSCLVHRSNFLLLSTNVR